ncbi:RELT-like protein 1 isoform X1 [Varanus komodoensis]|uniref:RELT like 1 n=2 Tax=Varanus komodoensis TaxID=61221 RepID=A0A8D2J8L1_VARKO|nr:RELT-like protein 1 isoform X1 [Varanus komodoensis]
MAPLGLAVTFSSFSPASLAAPTARASDSSPLASIDVLASHSNENTPSNDVATGSAHPEYIAYFLIPVFFLMGLLGIFICHILKKKGYRCTTEAEQEEEKLEEKIELNDSTNDNGDTVGKIVDYIMKNEANADVLKAMVADNSVYDPESPTSPTTPGSPTSPISPLSSGGPQSKHTCRGRHLHTVGGIAGTEACTRCSQKRWHLFSPAKKSKDARKARHGEVTVLSVGRFRVTKVEHKSASKERRNLMSVSSGEGVNGEMPATPVKEDSKEAPVTPAIKQGSKQLPSTPAEQGSRVRTDAD